MSGILTALDDGTNQQACADVVISPSSGNTGMTVSVSSTTDGAHIFYRLASFAPGVTPDAPAPVHVGDNAVSPTIRIGSNAGSINISAGPPGGIRTLSCVAYKAGLVDSNITYGEYDVPEGGL